MNEWKIKVHIPRASRLRLWGLAGAGSLPHQLSAAPSLEQKVFWLAGKQPVSQKGGGEEKKKKKRNSNKKIILNAVVRGGERAAVAQSCESQAERSRYRSISARGLGSCLAAREAAMPLG